MELSPHAPNGLVPLAEFTANLPVKQGIYTLARINNEFSIKHFDFYYLTIEPACPLSEPWGDIRIAEIVSVKDINGFKGVSMCKF